MKKQNLEKFVILGFIFLIAVFLLAISDNQNIFVKKISNFEECAEAGYVVMESYPRQCNANGNHFVEVINTAVSQEIADYFFDKLIDEAIDLSGGLMPIEGFTPRMYTDIFLELKEEDFNNVEAISGIWKYADGELIFVDSNDGVFTSADGTVNKIGMKSLLENLKQRLNIQLGNLSDIDNLIILLSQEPVRNFCSDESRKADFCIEIYQPVCGWNNPEKIQCIKFPCASTYSNSCNACQNEDVLYWTQGICPSE